MNLLKVIGHSFPFEKIAHLQVDLLGYFLAVLLTYLVSRFFVRATLTMAA